MTLIQDYLWSNVFWCSANGKGSALIEHFGESKVRKFQVPIIGDEQVFRFEVSENDVLVMQIFKTTGHYGTVEPRLICSKGLNRSQVGEQFTAIDQLQDQVKVLRVLGKSLKVYDEGMTDLRMDEVFVIDVVDLLGFDDLPLVQKFQGHVLSRLFVLGDLHLTEPSLAEDSSHFVVFEF